MRLTHNCAECRHPLVMHLDAVPSEYMPRRQIAGTEDMFVIGHCEWDNCECKQFAVRAHKNAVTRALEVYRARAEYEDRWQTGGISNDG